MANVRISQLPTAPQPISGSELIPIVQSGQTVQTTIADILSAPTLTQTFITLNQESTLPNSRYMAVGSGLSLTDGGAQSTYSIGLIGAISTINALSNGVLVKSGSTVISRSIAVSGSGLSVTNGTGVSGDPTIALTGNVLTLASASGTGLVGINGSSSLSILTIVGTANQISVTNGNGASGSPTIGIASNPVIPGSASLTVPIGATSARPSGVNGMIRYNTDTALFEGFVNGTWSSFASGSGVTSIATGTGLTGGPITSTGTISIADTAVTAGTYGSSTQVGTFTVNAQGQLTSASNVSISASSIGAVTSVSGAGSVNGITLTGTVTSSGDLTLGGTLSGIGNSQLTNSSVTIGTTTISLGGTSLTLGGLTSVTVTQDPTSALQLATKQYVDSVAQGLDAKASCLYGTTNNITLSGLATQAGGDWASSLTAGDRILVKNQSSSQFNGIYLANASTWTRALDMDTWAEVPSSFVFIEDGSTLADTGWVTTANAGGTIDVTPMPWVQFSGAGTYTAGTGLTLSGTQFSITNTAVTAGSYGSASQVATFTVNAQGQLTLAGNTSIAISASQVTSGTLAVAQGGTNLASYAVGDIVYASGTTTLAGLTVGTANYVLTSSGTAPQYVAQSTLSVGSATYASTVTLSAGSGSTNYLVYASTATGNVAEYTSTGLTYNATDNAITGGINGGTF